MNKFEDKSITLFLIKSDEPALYETLQLKGDLQRLSDGELLHIYASSATESEDVSDIPDSDIEPVNHKLIDNVTRIHKEMLYGQ